MNNERPNPMTVKETYENCKGGQCPRLSELMKTREDGTKYFVEGDMAYYAMTLCNNWAIGMSDGDCAIKPSDSETAAAQ